jgi:hypothetical protein
LVEICFSAAANPLTGIAADAWPIAKPDPRIPSAIAVILSLVTITLQSQPDTSPAKVSFTHRRWLKAEGVVAQY